MGHITVARLKKLLARLPEGVRVAPSVGKTSLVLWNESDEEPIGTIKAVGEEEYDVEMFEAYEDRLRSGS